MILLRWVAALMLCFVALPAAAQDIAQAPPTSVVVASGTSPSGTIKVQLTLNPEGRIGYSVTRLGKPELIKDSRYKTAEIRRRLDLRHYRPPALLRRAARRSRSTTRWKT